MMIPMFWSPGMIARASSPTMKPTMIMMMMLMRVLLARVKGRCAPILLMHAAAAL